MKALLVLAALLSLPAHADFNISLRANPMICEGETSAPFSLMVQYNGRTGGNHIVYQISEVTPYSFETGSLNVSNEGNTYMQQVDNDAGYNLILAGDGVDQLAKDALSQKVSGEYILKGRLSILSLKNAAVVCRAKFAK